MRLMHPTITSISIGGVEYRPNNGVFDMPDSAADIAIADFGMEVARVDEPSAKPAAAKRRPPRSSKPKKQAQERIGNQVFFAPGNTAAPMCTSLPSSQSSATWLVHYRIMDAASNGGHKENPESRMDTRRGQAPGSSIGQNASRLGYSPGAYLSYLGSWPDNLLRFAPVHGTRPDAELGNSLVASLAGSRCPARSPDPVYSFHPLPYVGADTWACLRCAGGCMVGSSDGSED